MPPLNCYPQEGADEAKKVDLMQHRARVTDSPDVVVIFDIQAGIWTRASEIVA